MIYIFLHKTYNTRSVKQTYIFLAKHFLKFVKPVVSVNLFSSDFDLINIQNKTVLNIMTLTQRNFNNRVIFLKEWDKKCLAKKKHLQNNKFSIENILYATYLLINLLFYIVSL